MGMSDALKDLKDKAQDALDKTDLDEKLFDAVDKAQDKAKEVLDKTDLDEKIMDAAGQVKDKAEGVVSDLKDKLARNTVSH